MGCCILSIDTSSPVGSVALLENDSLLGEMPLSNTTKHAESLLGAIDLLLYDAKRGLDSIDALAVAHGPGSFTGLRVGIATAKGLAFAHGLPLIGVSTLEALVNNLAYASHQVCAMLDARKNEVYAGLYESFSGGFHLQAAEQVVSPEALLKSIGEDTIFVGDGATRYRTLIVATLGRRAHFVSPVHNQPRAAIMAYLASRKMSQSNPVSADILAPVYIRPSEAEIAYNRKHQADSIEG